MFSLLSFFRLGWLLRLRERRRWRWRSKYWRTKCKQLRWRWALCRVAAAPAAKLDWRSCQQRRRPGPITRLPVLRQRVAQHDPAHWRCSLPRRGCVSVMRKDLHIEKQVEDSHGASLQQAVQCDHLKQANIFVSFLLKEWQPRIRSRYLVTRFRAPQQDLRICQNISPV